MQLLRQRIPLVWMPWARTGLCEPVYYSTRLLGESVCSSHNLPGLGALGRGESVMTRSICGCGSVMGC